jgi:hypothetical protein
LQKQVTERQNIYGISLYIKNKKLDLATRDKKKTSKIKINFFRGDKLLNAQREVWQKEKKIPF